MIAQGEIREFEPGGLKVVILSNTAVSNEAYPIVASIRRGVDNIPPYLIALAEQDPVSGSVDVARLAHVNPDQLGKVVGMVTGDTWQRLLAAVRELFEEGA